MIALPEVRSVELAPGDEFVVLATDGVWDMLSSQARGHADTFDMRIRGYADMRIRHAIRGYPPRGCLALGVLLSCDAGACFPGFAHRYPPRTPGAALSNAQCTHPQLILHCRCSARWSAGI